MQVKNENKEFFNIDELTLSMYCPSTLFEEFSQMASEMVYDNLDGYTITCIEKNDIENPTKIVIAVDFNPQLPFGIFMLDRGKERAYLSINKQICYETLNVINGIKSNLLPCVEYIISNLGFDLDTVILEKMTLVRDSQFNIIKMLSLLNSTNKFDVILNETKQKDPVYLIDKYFIKDTNTSYNKFSRMHKQNVFYSCNLIGTIEIACYEKSKEIHNVSHEYFIFNYIEIPENEKFFRTEIILHNNFQLKKFYKEKGIEDHGFFTLNEYFTYDKIKELFDYLLPKLIRFENKETGEIINI